ncbi:MAG: sensor histidine kinase [Acidimicrobiales bacterium]
MISTVLRPWTDRSLWPTLVHLVTGLAVGPIVFTVTIVGLATSVSLLITFPLALPVIWLTFVSARILGHLERLRASALLDLDLLDPVPDLVASNWFARLWERAKSWERWREIGHHVALLPVGIIHGGIVVWVWTWSLALAAMPLYAGSLPGGTAKLWIGEVGPGPVALVLAAVGVVGLVVVAPWTTLLLGRLHRAFLRALLGPSREVELSDAVSSVEHSRVAAVDTAEAERRRIERDLHDGAQQRLVSLAVTLGDAHERLDSDPEQGRALVAEAHQEAKAALAELRDLVRGIHPVILEDRGLDAALSAIVARSPVPVDLHVDVDVRPPPAVESAAYFIVSEALANVATHAGAHRAEVNIVRSRDRLVVEIRDDGIGGADPRGGTGLDGLRNRVDALSGRFHLSSPPGGPTTVLVELPCVS